MIHYVLLGIELDLYAPSEYGTIYWCVCFCFAVSLLRVDFAVLIRVATLV